MDEDRKINAQKFEVAFYSNSDLRSIKPPEQQNTINLTGLIEQLKSSPELVQTLAELVNTGSARTLKQAERCSPMQIKVC